MSNRKSARAKASAKAKANSSSSSALNAASAEKKMPTTRIVNIDIVTGQEIQRAYFDPTRAIGLIIPDDDWLGDHLFVPASIVGHDEKHDTLSLKVPEGGVYKVPRNSVAYINPQEDEGVHDILKLHKFSEMSLIYTLRIRYNRDEVYTFVGPILIAINPYKWLAHLYSEETMNEYHSNKAVCCLLLDLSVIYYLLILMFTLFFRPLLISHICFILLRPHMLL
jgi:hypothetical protein